MTADAWTFVAYAQAAQRCGAKEFEAFVQACAQGSIPDHLPRLSRSAERTLRAALAERGISIEQEQLDPDDDLPLGD